MGAVNAGAVQVEIDYPPRLSRLLLFVKWLAVFPHYVVLYVLGIVAAFVVWIAWFATIILGRYPRPLFDFIVGLERWRLRVGAYQLLQTDRYPPFSLQDDPDYPVRLEVLFPDRVARWRPLLTWLLVIPAQIVNLVVAVVALLGSVIAWFAILITGRYPRPLFNLVGYALILSTKCVLYGYWLITEYPLASP